MKATRIFTMGNEYYRESEFEYRGHTYTVEYSSSYSAFKKKPAYLQHKENQERIDRLIENPIKVEEPKVATFNIDEIFELLDWN